MTIAREAARSRDKKLLPKIIDVTGLQLFPPPDRKGIKHFNFQPKNASGRGGLYCEE